MKTKQFEGYTPGPWFINGPYDSKEDLFIRATVEGENFDLANLGCDETGKYKANAALIASAPELLKERDELKAINAELLEALKLIEGNFPELETDEEMSGADTVETLALIWPRIKSAIAKAEGRA